MKNINTLILSFLIVLAGFFQTDAVLGGGLVADEMPVLERDAIQVFTHSFDLTELMEVKVRDMDTGQIFWLESDEKSDYLYTLEDVDLWLSTNNEIELNPSSNYLLKTEKGTAFINTNTGILNYTPKANATGNDILFYKIKCNTCTDDRQKTIALSFSTAGKTSANLQETSDLIINNYPNPFTERTVVQYGLNQDGHTNIQLYNTAGTLLQTLKTSEFQKAGTYSFELEAKDLPNGVYYINIQSGEQAITQSIIKL